MLLGLALLAPVAVSIGAQTAATGATVFADDFNDGSIDQTKWVSTAGVKESGACGSNDGGSALVFSGSASPRHATTRELDVSRGGTIEFFLKAGDGQYRGNCEDVSSWERMRLQYNVGSGWSTIARYGPTDVFANGEFANQFVPITEQIPSEAETESTQFRWAQHSHDGGGWDVWVIDDVVIDAAGAVDTVGATVPGDSASVDVPGVATPAVPNQTVGPTPPVGTPPTCDVDPCQEETTVVDEQTVTTPEVPVEQTCTPADIVCVGPFTIPSQEVGPTPPVSTPAACDATEDAICLGPVTVLGPQEEQTPGVGSIPLTPPATVSAQLADTNLVLAPQIGETDSVGPFNLTVTVPVIGEVPIVVCASECPVPATPGFSVEGELTVTVTVGEDSHTTSVPVDLEE